MEHKEIFKELANCKIKGMMFHSNMADFYAFLNLDFKNVTKFGKYLYK